MIDPSNECAKLCCLCGASVPVETMTSINKTLAGFYLCNPCAISISGHLLHLASSRIRELDREAKEHQRIIDAARMRAQGIQKELEEAEARYKELNCGDRPK